MPLAFLYQSGSLWFRSFLYAAYASFVPPAFATRRAARLPAPRAFAFRLLLFYRATAPYRRRTHRAAASFRAPLQHRLRAASLLARALSTHLKRSARAPSRLRAACFALTAFLTTGCAARTHIARALPRLIYAAHACRYVRCRAHCLLAPTLTSRLRILPHHTTRTLRLPTRLTASCDCTVYRCGTAYFRCLRLHLHAAFVHSLRFARVPNRAYSRRGTRAARWRISSAWRCSARAPHRCSTHSHRAFSARHLFNRACQSNPRPRRACHLASAYHPHCRLPHARTAASRILRCRLRCGSPAASSHLPVLPRDRSSLLRLYAHLVCDMRNGALPRTRMLRDLCAAHAAYACLRSSPVRRMTPRLLPFATH